VHVAVRGWPVDPERDGARGVEGDPETAGLANKFWSSE
jgi:hypothetical protein